MSVESYVAGVRATGFV